MNYLKRLSYHSTCWLGKYEIYDEIHTFISSIHRNILLSGMCATNMTDPALHVSPDQNTEKLSELLPVYCIDCEITANTGFW